MWEIKQLPNWFVRLTVNIYKVTWAVPSGALAEIPDPPCWGWHGEVGVGGCMVWSLGTRVGHAVLITLHTLFQHIPRQPAFMLLSNAVQPDRSAETESASELLMFALLLTHNDMVLWCSMVRQWMWQTGSVAFVSYTAHLMACLKKRRLHPSQSPKSDAADHPKKFCRGYEVDSDSVKLPIAL